MRQRIPRHFTMSQKIETLETLGGFPQAESDSPAQPSKVLGQFLNRDIRLREDACQRPHVDRAMIRHRHAGRAFHKPDMASPLPVNREAHPLQCPDNLRAAQVTGQLHAKARAGSSVK